MEQSKEKFANLLSPQSKFNELQSSQQQRVKHKITFGEYNNPVNSLRFDESGKYIATACYDGGIRIYNTNTNKLSFELKGKQPLMKVEQPFSRTNSQKSEPQEYNQLQLINPLDSIETDVICMPVTCVRWRPQVQGKSKKILICVNADGTISQWHMYSGKQIYQFKEKSTCLLCCDYRPDGRAFVAAGTDTYLHLYDDTTKQKIAKLKPKNFNQNRSMGHSNRIFCVKYNKDDPNIICSGG